MVAPAPATAWAKAVEVLGRLESGPNVINERSMERLAAYHGVDVLRRYELGLGIEVGLHPLEILLEFAKIPLPVPEFGCSAPMERAVDAVLIHDLLDRSIDARPASQNRRPRRGQTS